MKKRLHAFRLFPVFVVLLVLLLTLRSSFSFAADRYAVANGNWNGTIWAATSGGTAGSATVPTSTDAVYINDNRNVTVNTTATCASLTIVGGVNVSYITISNSNSLTVSGAITINAGTGNGDNKYIAVGAGSLTAESVTIANTGADNRDSYISISTGTVTISGNITMNGTAARNQIVFTGAGTLNVGGTITDGTISSATGGYTALTNGTVNYNGTNQTIGNYNYYNLTLSNSGTQTLQTGTTSIAGNLTLSGTVTTTTVVGLTIGGNLIIGNGTTFNATGYALTVTGATTVNGSLVISAYNGTKTFTGLVTVNSGGTWDNSSISSPVNFRGGITNNGTFTSGGGAQTFTTNTQALNGTLNFTGPVTVTGITLTNNGELTLSGNVSGTGTLTNASTGTINNNSELTIAIVTNNGTFNKTGGNLTPTTLTNTGILSISGMVYTNPTTFTNSGTINYSSSSGIGTAAASFTNTGAINLNGTGYITGITNNAGGTVNLNTLASGTTIGTLNNATSTSVLNINALTTNTSFITTLTATTAGNTVNYSGTGDQAIKNTTYQNLILSGSGTKAFLAAATISGNITINSGAIANLATFTHSAANLYFNAAIQASGSWGGTASSAANKNATYFTSTTGTTGILNVAANSSSGFWYKADAAGTTTDGAGVSTWPDQSGRSNNATSQLTAPLYKLSGWNFNPKINFSSGYFLTANNGITDDMTFFAVYNSIQSTTSGSFWLTPAIIGGETSGATNDYTLSTNAGKIYFKGITGDNFGAQTTAVYNSSALYSEGTPYIVAVTRPKSSSGTIYLYVNGAQAASASSDNASLNGPTKLGIGNHFSYQSGAQFVGDISEVYGINSMASAAVRQNMESYLAIKYGITLGHSYTNSGGTTVYDVSTYANNVAGLGYDVADGLNQKVSASINLPAGNAFRVVMANNATSDFTSSNLSTSRTALTGDGQYLIWGDNCTTNSSFSPTWSITLVEIYSIISNRTWKVQNTKSVGAVSFQIDLGSSASSVQNYALLVSADNSFPSGTTTAYPLTNASGTLYTVSGITFPVGTSYFTIGKCNLPSQPSAITGNATPCVGSSQTYSVDNVSGVTYNWILPSGWTGTSTTNSIIATVGSGSGSISVTPSTSCGSGTARTISVSVNVLPSVFNVTGGGSYCSGGSGVAVGLSGSESGVTYQLKREETVVGSAVSGTGSAISFGNQATAGVYTVEATRTSGSCTATMNGGVIVTVNTSSTISTQPSSTAICSGNSTSLTVVSSLSNVLYQWQTASSTDGPWSYVTSAFNTNPVFFASDFSTQPSNTNLYGDPANTATISNGYLQLTSANASLLGGFVIQSTPGANLTAFNVNFDYRIYDGSGADGFSLSYGPNIANNTGTGEEGEGSGIIVKFDTYDNSSSGTGTNSQIRINYNGDLVSGGSNNLGAFNLRNTNYRNVNIYVDQSGKLSLSIGETQIFDNLVLPAGYVTADKSAWKFKFSGRTGGLNDTHRIDNLRIQYGDNSSLSVTPTSNTYYRAVVTSGTCSTNSNSALVTVNTPSTAPTAITGTTTICSGSTTVLTASGGTAGTNCTYEWGTGSTIGSNIISDATSVSYTTPNLTTTTTYWIRRKDPAPCSNTTGGTIQVVTVRDAFTAGGIVTTGQTICYNGDPGVIGSSTAASGGDNITYEWRANGTPIANSNSETYDPPAGLTATTVYTRWAKDNTCSTTFTQSTGSWTVTVNPLPTLGILSASPSTLCAGSDITLTVTGLLNGANTFYYDYTFNASTNSSSQDLTPAGGTATVALSNLAAGSYQIKVNSISVNSCTANFTTNNTVSWTVTAQPVAPTITKSPTDATVCSGQTLSVGIAAGTGGTGTVADEYRYSTNNGTNWSSWSTTVPSFAAVIGTNMIESRRTSTGTGCSTSSSNQVQWTVNPTPSVTTANTAVICSGESPNISLTPSSVSNFSWTVGTITGGITGASAGSGTSINQTLTNPIHTAAGTVQYIVTPMAGSCPGPAYTITVTVNPIPGIGSFN